MLTCGHPATRKTSVVLPVIFFLEIKSVIRLAVENRGAAERRSLDVKIRALYMLIVARYLHVRGAGPSIVRMIRDIVVEIDAIGVRIEGICLGDADSVLRPRQWHFELLLSHCKHIVGLWRIELRQVRRGHSLTRCAYPRSSHKHRGATRIEQPHGHVRLILLLWILEQVCADQI